MKKTGTKKVAVLGDGGWGTTLALLLFEKEMKVALWGAFPDYVEEMRRSRVNGKFLPGINIPRGVEITADLREALSGTEVIITAVPSQYMREVCRRAAPLLGKGGERFIINGAKGIEIGSLMRMSEVIAEEIPGVPVAVLSGPSHAEEVARKSPTTVVVSSAEESLSLRAQALLMTGRFRVYTNPDMVGVEIGGAIKNVIAIAAGAVDGLGFGDNAKAALITRGIVEIARLGVTLGARPSTFWGLAGIGDLITTCVSRFGRNRRVGELIARGESLERVTAEMDMIAEGIPTTEAAHTLSKEHGVEMPITEQVYEVLYRGKDPATAVRELMQRSAKPELDGFPGLSDK